MIFHLPGGRGRGLKNLTQECAASRVCLIPKSVLTTCVKQFELLRIRAWSCSVMKPIPLIFPALEHMSVNIHRSLILQPPLAFCCFHIPSSPLPNALNPQTHRSTASPFPLRKEKTPCLSNINQTWHNKIQQDCPAWGLWLPRQCLAWTPLVGWGPY